MNRSNFITTACTYKIYFQKNRIVNHKDYKCNLFYSILRDKKFDTPLHQLFLARNFNIQRQETAKDGMTGNIIGKNQLRTNINAEVNIRYFMTLNRRSQG